NPSSSVNFSPNRNSVVCLPLVSEGLKLVWTQSDQTSELDSDERLVEAFSRFPYPSAAEIKQLCRASGLPLDKVKVWLMVQRIRYGISWSSEEIEETRLKLGQGRGREVEEEEEEEEGGGVDLEEVERNDRGTNCSNLDPRAGCANGVADSSASSSATPGSYKKPETHLVNNNSRASGGNPSLSTPDPSRPSFEPVLNRSLEAVAHGFKNSGKAEDRTEDGGVGARERLLAEGNPDGGTTLRTPPHHRNGGSQANPKKSKPAPFSSGPSPLGPSLLTPNGRLRKTKEQLSILKAFFLRCQWPQNSDYARLTEESGLPRSDIIQWFGDTRYAVKNGHLRWVRGSGLGSDIASDLLQKQQTSPLFPASPSNSRAKRKREREREPGAWHGARDEGSVPGSNVDMRPLERYFGSTGFLQEKDLGALCMESRMNCQQVREWFVCRQEGMAEVEVDISDGEG
ncbi:HOMEZ protein, partial [Polyodon spathula]|nr:HOMEZ protein [Polyodon spathula]